MCVVKEKLVGPLHARRPVLISDAESDSRYGGRIYSDVGEISMNLRNRGSGRTAYLSKNNCGEVRQKRF